MFYCLVVGLYFFSFCKQNKFNQRSFLRNTCVFRTHRPISQVTLTPDDKSFNSPLTSDEISFSTKFGIDSHADTSCVNKHAYIEAVVDGITDDAIPFDSQLGKMSNLPIVHKTKSCTTLHCIRTMPYSSRTWIMHSSAQTKHVNTVPLSMTPPPTHTHTHT